MRRLSRRTTALKRYYGISHVVGPTTVDFNDYSLTMDFQVIDPDQSSYKYVKLFSPKRKVEEEVWSEAKYELDTLLIIDASEHGLVYPVSDWQFEGEFRYFCSDALTLATWLRADILFKDQVWTRDPATGTWARVVPQSELSLTEALPAHE